MRAVLQRLHRELTIFEPDVRETGGVVALLGPAGVGKTTSISKIAAAYAMRHGIDDVALVTTDSYRIAGHEQLKTLGKILRVPMRVVTEQHPLEQVLEQLSNKKLILVDTAGLSNRDQDFDEQMKLLEKLPKSVTRLLVLASTSQKRILEKAVEDYQTLRLDGCILTKLDECASLGEALSVVVDARLPVAYTTDGQNIPDDIERPRVADLLGQAMDLASRSELQDEDTAEWFGDEMAQQPAFDGAA
jgi:flagellar biosynthesis protein FlhF